MILDLDEVIIRPSVEEDSPDICDLVCRCIREVNSRDYNEEETARSLGRTTVEHQNRRLRENHMYSVLYDGNIIAVCGVAQRQKDIEEGTCYLSSVFVNPDYHGKGLGKYMVEHLLNNSVCISQSRRVNVPSSKTAHGFYEKLGFSYYGEPGVPNSDGHVMMYMDRRGC